MLTNDVVPIEEPSIVGGSRRARPLVLIVEDDRDNAHLIARVLTGVKYDLLVTSVGVDAIQHAQTVQPDAITLDLRLPDIDGLDLLVQLKAGEDTRDIPVIVISVFADERDVRMAGAFATLSKPIDRNLLRQTVEAAVNQHRQA